MTGRQLEAPPISEGWVCKRCAGLHGAHFLTCPALRLPPGWAGELAAARAGGPGRVLAVLRGGGGRTR